jgi:hypothetical protein
MGICRKEVETRGPSDLSSVAGKFYAIIANTPGDGR